MAQAKKSPFDRATNTVRCLTCGKPLKSYDALCQHLADAHFGINSSDKSEVAVAAIAAGQGAKLSLSTRRSAQKTLLGDLIGSSADAAFPSLADSAAKEKAPQTKGDARTALLAYAKSGGVSRSAPTAHSRLSSRRRATRDRRRQQTF